MILHKYVLLSIVFCVANAACIPKTSAEWEALGCVVSNPGGNTKDTLGTITAANTFSTCNIECESGVWTIDQTCAAGYEESNCEICPSCIALTTEAPVSTDSQDDSCYKNICIDASKRDSMGLNKIDTDAKLVAFSKTVTNKQTIHIAQIDSIRSVPSDTTSKKRTRLKTFARQVLYDNIEINEFSFDKNAIPTSMFKREARIVKVRVFRTGVINGETIKHIINKIDKTEPIYAPLENMEEIEFEIDNQVYTFKQNEHSIDITWPDDSTVSISTGETIIKNNYLFTGGSIIIEPADDDCQVFEDNYRTSETILASYNNNDCCGSTIGQCSTDVLEYKCAGYCS